MSSKLANQSVRRGGMLVAATGRAVHVIGASDIYTMKGNKHLLVITYTTPTDGNALKYIKDFTLQQDLNKFTLTRERT